MCRLKKYYEKLVSVFKNAWVTQAFAVVSLLVILFSQSLLINKWFALGSIIILAASNFLNQKSFSIKLKNFNSVLLKKENLVGSFLQEFKSLDQNTKLHLVESLANEGKSLADEISNAVSTNAELVSSVIANSSSSEDSALAGKESIEEMISLLTNIQKSTEEVLSFISTSNLEMKEIVNIINTISSKTKVINDIAFQTKLLSFNASVEAARAGESGKGFTAVAQEIGSLARLSVASSVEINTLIEESVQKVQAIASLNNEKMSALILQSESNLKAGQIQLSNCDDKLNEIVCYTTVISTMTSEILNKNNDQNNKIDLIKVNLGSILENKNSSDFYFLSLKNSLDNIKGSE